MNLIYKKKFLANNNNNYIMALQNKASTRRA